MILKILVCLGVVFVLWVSHCRAAECWKYDKEPIMKMLCLTEDTNLIVKDFGKQLVELDKRLTRDEFIVYGGGSIVLALIIGIVGIGRHLLLKWLEMKMNGGRKYSTDKIDWTNMKGK